MNSEAEKEIPTSEAGMSFRLHMTDMYYGYDETIDAWHWFEEGWDAKNRSEDD